MGSDLTWVDGTGVEHPMATADLVVERGVSGRYGPPVSIASSPVAGLHGARVRNVRYEPREVAVPMNAGADWRESVRDWSSRFDPTLGDGRLRCGTRELVCRYTGGLENAAETAPTFRRWVALFTAFDPLWRDVEPSVQVVAVDEIPFLSSPPEAPWFPWVLVGSDAMGGFTVTNDGDDVAWPVWTVQGPGHTPTLTNATSGERIEVDVTLAAGEQMVIDTRPGAKTVQGPDGNLWAELTDDSELWPLLRGSQEVEASLADAVSGQSRVRLEFRRRWLSV